MSVKEQRKMNEAINGLMEELRDARTRMEAKCPGKPCVELPLDAVSAFRDADGKLRAVVTVDQVLYLADEVLRAGRDC